MAVEVSSKLERLVRDIKTEGSYTSDEEVLLAALHLLQEHEQLRKDQLSRIARSKWAIGLWAAQVLATIAAILAGAVEIESIIGTGPAMSITGLALAFVARPLRSWRVLLFSLSAPVLCALCAFLIALFRWDPGEAQTPIMVILSIFGLLAIPAAAMSLRSILLWHNLDNSRRPFVWRYSLRSLLVTTTALCVLLALGRLVVVFVGLQERLVFGLFSLATLTLVGTVLCCYIAGRRQV